MTTGSDKYFDLDALFIWILFGFRNKILFGVDTADFKSANSAASEMRDISV